MTEIYLCDDEPAWIKQMEQAVSDFMVSSDWALGIVCSATEPGRLLDCLSQRKTSGGIYLLDIDLKSEMNGIELGAGIRELDPDAVLIFVTTHDELVMDTLRLKLQATDYILKDSGSLRSQIGETLRIVESRHDHSARRLSAPRIRLDAGGSCHYIIKDDIYFVESQTNQHKLLVHLRSEVFTLSMPLKEVAKRLGEDFVFCKRGCLVNPLHVAAIDRKSKEIVFDNRERRPYSYRALRLLAEKTSPAQSTTPLQAAGHQACNATDLRDL